MDGSQLSGGNSRTRKGPGSSAVSGNGEQNSSPMVSDQLGEPFWVFDRATYERDGRVVRLLKRWPAPLAMVAAGLVVVFLGLHLVDEFDRRGDRTWQKITAPTAPPRGSPLEKSPMQPPDFALSPAAARQMRDRLIRGELDREVIELFRGVPDYERCTKCLSECDAKAEDNAPWKAQECRRNCLRTCSEHGRKLLEL